MRVGIVAGETSGDLLGGPLMRSIQERVESVEFIGIGGEEMLNAGLQSLADIERLSVNGFIDPIRRLPDLYRILNRVVREFASCDVVVGVDFNVFNLMMEKRVKRLGIPTAHYVSPSVYAWRRGRIEKIGRSTDVVMTLFPFEPELYRAAGVRAEFVGHPIADEVDPAVSKATLKKDARASLGIGTDQLVIGLMPGSRRSEIRFHAPVFFEAAQQIAASSPTERVQFLVPYIRPSSAEVLNEYVSNFAGLDIVLHRDATRTVLQACDAAIVKSGTGTLEAMIAKTPMVVAYRIGELTFRFVRMMMFTDLVALPNILSNEEIVPEFLQQHATSGNLASALLEKLERASTSNVDEEKFTRLHRELRQNASNRAADVVLSLVDQS